MENIYLRVVIKGLKDVKRQNGITMLICSK